MTARAGSLHYFVDESLMGLGKALAIARTDLVHVGHPLIPEIAPGTEDTAWIPAVAARGMVAIGRDKRIRTKPGERALLRAHGLRYFWLGGSKDLSNWDALVRIVRVWPDIEAIVGNRPVGPWFMVINEQRITEVPL